MNHLAHIERERALEKIRGQVRGKRSSRAVGRGKRMGVTGPTFAELAQGERVELERYATEAGRDWRTDLIADCLRGSTRRAARFDKVLCPMVTRYGAKWFRRELQVPWEAR